MPPISRRDVLAGLAASSAASILPARSEQPQDSGTGSTLFLSGEERGRRADALLRYFAGVAPDLLRPPAGLLKHPSIAQSQPGKQYAKCSPACCRTSISISISNSAAFHRVHF